MSTAIPFPFREPPPTFREWSCETIADRGLRAASSQRAFELHQAALEWSLVDPIIINDESDIKSENWRDRGLKPFHHQVQNLITFCRRLPVALIADDVGLGKTISAGLILSELIARRRVNRAFIICPSVLTSQWVAELDDKFGLQAKEARGAALDAELNRTSTKILVTTYEGARDRLEKLEPGMFDLCILDEAHKLRNLHGSQKPPKMAVKVREALERRPFKFVMMLTATPIQNKVWDLYSLLDLLKTAEGRPNPLGRPAEFSAAYLQPGTDGRHIRHNARARFQQIVRDSLSRTRRGDVRLKFPDRNLHLVKVRLPAAELQLQTIVGRLIEDQSALMQVSLAQAMMSSPRALIAQMANMVRSGRLPLAAVEEAKHAAAQVPAPAKLARLLQIVDELREKKPDSWRMIVFTVRRETQEMIGEELQRRGIAVGFIHGGAPTENRASIAQYTADPPVIHALVSTDAGAEGVNLQAGNVLVNYDLPWNPMIVEQRIGRIQRLGSKFESIHVLNLVGADTVEDRIVARLTQKLQGVQHAIGDVEGILEAAGMDDEDGDASFESRIRKLVVQSLRGQDVARAQRMIEEDIERATELYETNQSNLNDTLGDGGQSPVAAMAMPKIERKPPRMTSKDFVLGAKEEQGFRIRPMPGGVFEAVATGRVAERLAFEEPDQSGPFRPVFSESAVKVYMPGTPPFEKLVQHWVDHHSHRIVDFTLAAENGTRDLARKWCGLFEECRFVDSNYTVEDHTFHGAITLRVKAGTGVDSLEKILRGRIKPPAGHTPVPVTEASPCIDDEVRISKIMSQFDRALRPAVHNDEDIGKFCSFYLGRLEECLRDTQHDPVRRAKVEGDLRPHVEAEVAGIEGVRYDHGRLVVRYTIDGKEYSSTLLVIPASGQILEQPEPFACHQTRRWVPKDALARCAATGEYVLRHRLEKLADGRFTSPEELVQCAATGERILRADSGVSVVSGKVVRKDLLVRCAVSGDPALASELEKSEVSGRAARAEFLQTSALSGRRGLPDEMVVCHPTQRTVFLGEARRSESTGEWYALDQLLRSRMSGTMVPPPDTVRCEATQDVLLPKERGQCVVSKKLVAADRIVRSEVSGLPMDRDSAARTDDGRVALPNEIGACQWCSRRLLLRELERCTLSELLVDRSLLNEDGELRPLRNMLDGRIAGIPLNLEEMAWLRTQPGWEKVATAGAFRSPQSNLAAVAGESRGWLGFGNRIIGGIVTLGETRQVLCPALRGSRRNGFWMRER